MGWGGILLLNRVRDVSLRFYYNLNGERGSAAEESRIKFSN